MPSSLPERSGLPRSLARLDRRVVPPLQRGARAVARGLGAPLRVVARAEERLFPRVVRRVVPAWQVPALLAAVIVLLASVVHLQRFPELRDAERGAAPGAEDPSVGAPPADELDPLDLSARSVGPRQGDALDEYAAARQDVLAGLAPADSRLAVVSFEEYATAEAALAAVGDDVQVLRAQFRIPAEGERPRETRTADADAADSIAAAIAQAVAPIEDEITEVEALLGSGTVDDPAFEADLERRRDELRAVLNILESDPAVVFALVVEGTGAELQALAERDAVRLVDPAPEVADPDTTAFYGLLPEDRASASTGSVG